MLNLDPKTSALVLIDLQKGIVGMPLAPHAAAEVVATGIKLATSFRKVGSPVVLVNVAWAKDFGDALLQPVDKPFPHPPGGLPENWAEYADGLAEPTDLRVTKHQWGAFLGTDLDVQLRRRGITTIVLGGVATNFGVESTARQAHEFGYELVLVENAMTSVSPEMHSFAIESIFPRIGRIVQAADIVLEK